MMTDLIPPCESCPVTLTIVTAHTCSECVARYMADMRRYLYRNVACEYRKGFADFSKMPDLPGWA